MELKATQAPMNIKSCWCQTECWKAPWSDFLRKSPFEKNVVWRGRLWDAIESVESERKCATFCFTAPCIFLWYCIAYARWWKRTDSRESVHQLYFIKKKTNTAHYYYRSKQIFLNVPLRVCIKMNTNSTALLWCALSFPIENTEFIDSSAWKH